MLIDGSGFHGKRPALSGLGLMVMGIAIVIALGSCSPTGGDESSSSETPTVVDLDALAKAYVPTVVDSYEPDDTVAQAMTLTVDGELQRRTLFGANDDDWTKVDLTAGTKYEFFTTNLNETGDTYLYLWDTDGLSYIDDNDDYVDYDSRILYTPTVSGTYYLIVQAYDPPTGIATYSLGARTFVDADGDFYGSFHDCNDSDATIYPFALEISGDGIDQDCSGVDQPLGTTADSAEPDDSIATANDLVETGGSYYEIIHRQDIYQANGRTLHQAGDMDYFRVVVPAYGAIEILLADSDVSVTVTQYNSDGTTVGPVSTFATIANTTASDVTYYLAYASFDSVATGWYVPAYVDLGTDQDGDGYYTGEWSGSRDCNDADPAIYDGATESTVADGIDSNCDGADGTASYVDYSYYGGIDPLSLQASPQLRRPEKIRQ